MILLFIFFSIPVFNYYELGWRPQDSVLTIIIKPGDTNSDSQNPIAPTNVIVSERTTIIWLNDDSSTHQLVSGTPDQGPSNIFYGDYFGAGESDNTTIDNAGIYNYYDPTWSHIRGQITVIPHNDTDLEANDGGFLDRADTGVTAE
jgi:hypothetical protein